MIITCPRCLATYTVPDNALGAQGRKLRCSSCHFEWQETPPPQEAIAGLAPVPAPAPAPAPKPAPAAPRKTEPAATKPKPAAKPKKDSSAAVMTFVVLAAVVSGLILARNTVSGLIPAMEDVYEGIGLPVGSPAEWFTLTGTGVESAEDGNRLTLTVHGEINNISKRERELPAIRITWYGKDGTIGSNTVVRSATSRLAPGEKASFVGTLRRVDTSAGGEVRMVPWLGSEAMVVTPDMQGHNNLTGNARPAHTAPAEARPTHAAPAPAQSTPAPHEPVAPESAVHEAPPAAPAHEALPPETLPPETTPPEQTSHEPTAHEPTAHEPAAPAEHDAAPALPAEGGHH